MPVTVRQAGREDLPAIIAIEEASFSVPWSHQSLAAELDNPVAKYYVLEGETGQVLGYADVWLIADEGQLANIAIHPSARGHGYGETLLRTAMEALFQDGCTSMFLEVRQSNAPAQGLYRKLGYEGLLFPACRRCLHHAVSERKLPMVQPFTIKRMKSMYTLALETSCDETSAAVIEDGRHICSNIISTQVPIHRKFGGVVPEIASRQHIEYVLPIIKEALDTAQVTLADIDHIGVTYGPGLVGALLVGVAAAKAISFAADKPLVGVNHMEGHIFANFLSHPELEPPFLALVVSGGHTQLVQINGYNSFKLMGQTRDDAAGEAFDKIARVMGYPYPGGPQIDKLAKEGNPDAIAFPKALHEKHNFEFSFSGLKSAVLNYLHTQEQRGQSYNAADVAASFQKTVVETLVEKTMDAASYCGAKKIAVAGGVSANSGLAAAMSAACADKGYAFYRPDPILCTDNGAMIGCRAYYMALDGRFADLTLNAKPALPITSD